MGSCSRAKLQRSWERRWRIPDTKSKAERFLLLLEVPHSVTQWTSSTATLIKVS